MPVIIPIGPSGPRVEVATPGDIVVSSTRILAPVGLSGVAINTGGVADEDLIDIADKVVDVAQGESLLIAVSGIYFPSASMTWRLQVVGVVPGGGGEIPIFDTEPGNIDEGSSPRRFPFSFTRAMGAVPLAVSGLAVTVRAASSAGANVTIEEGELSILLAPGEAA